MQREEQGCIAFLAAEYGVHMPQGEPEPTEPTSVPLSAALSAEAKAPAPAAPASPRSDSGDSGDSGWGTYAAPGPERLRSWARNRRHRCAEAAPGPERLEQSPDRSSALRSATYESPLPKGWSPFSGNHDPDLEREINREVQAFLGEKFEVDSEENSQQKDDDDLAIF